MFIKQLAVPNCELGESPVWCDINQHLYYLDILQTKLYIYEPNSGDFEAHHLPSLTSAIILTNVRDNVILVSDDGLLVYDLSKHLIIEVLACYPETKGVTRPNESSATPNGDIVFGTMPYIDASEDTIGRWYRFSHKSKTSSTMGLPVGIPNTLCWFNHNLYFADSTKQTLYKSDFDMENPTVFFKDTGNNVPDGSCISNEGILWNAKWGGNCLIGYDIHTQEIIKTINISAINPTSCCFGGENLSTLFITSAYVDTDNSDVYQGGIYECQNAGFGRATHRYLLKH